MSITNELRKYATVSWDPWPEARDRLLQMCDRIDAEHEAKVSYWQGASYKDGYDEGFASADDWLAQHEDAMAEHGWVRLPLDADGVPIHIGDVLTDDAEFKSEGKVMRLMLENGGWTVGFGCGGWTEPSIHEWHHYHAPTVEDVLTEFGIDWEHESDCEDRAALLKEYAKRLRLVNDEE